LHKRAEGLRENNPMLGHRGVRLGITYPEIAAMQVRAIFEAAGELIKEGKKAYAEIMIPVTGMVNELSHQKKIVTQVYKEVCSSLGLRSIPYMFGTMIEIPRAALTAGKMAEEAEFFSFGTNDLTQMGFGFSRDDIGSFLPDYLREKILPADPFQTIDQEGIGELIKIGIDRGRASRPNLKVGICGEHGGDPESVKFCHRVGMSYVSCSPFRVPIARLAAAQAAIEDLKKESGTVKKRVVLAKKEPEKKVSPKKEPPKKVLVKKAPEKKVVAKKMPVKKMAEMKKPVKKGSKGKR
jgi:pyruvate,orthophosphate dikinase